MDVFDVTAHIYDTDRAKLIPCFEDLYGTAVALIPDKADCILDLGAGTGLLSSVIRSRFADARLHLLDQSRPMLAKAEELFSCDQKVLCQTGDYTTARWGASYDAVVSALSIHHLTDEQKKFLFKRVRGALQQGGVFVNAEQVLQETPELEAEAKAQWLSAVRQLGATEQQIAASLLRQTEDRCATIEDQLLWLREAGFREARCAFADGRFAVFFAE